MPQQVKERAELKALFFDLIDDLAYQFIAKKVAKQNGDIRVAFDLMKSALELLKRRILAWSGPIEDNLSKVRVSCQLMLDVYEQKHGTKIAGKLRSQPRQNMMLLKAIAGVFDEEGEEKLVCFSKIFAEINLICRQFSIPRMSYPEFFSCMDELENYNFIRIERHKKDPKQSSIGL